MLAGEFKMKTQNLEKKLKKIHPEFHIVDLKDRDIFDLVAIRFGKYTVCGCPANNVYPERKKEYTDVHGVQHRTSGEVIALCMGFIDKYNYDKSFKKLVDKYESANDK